MSLAHGVPTRLADMIHPRPLRRLRRSGSSARRDISADPPQELPGGHGAAQRVRPLPADRILRDPKAAAFFDVDNTVVQGASLFHLAKGLYRRGFFPLRLILRGAWLNIYFRVVGKENPEHIAQAREASLDLIKGHTVEELEAAADEIYSESIEARIWPGTRAIAQQHLDVGQPVWLVTAAPIEVATMMAFKLGLTGALGSRAEEVDGVYTGHLVGDLLHGQAKADAMQALADEHGFDLARCHAYSDSYNDLPMLSLVGYPCAINPDGRLKPYALQRGWEIRDYRSGRQALRFGLLSATVLGAATGAVVTTVATKRWFGRR